MNQDLSVYQLGRITYTHDAMIDLLIAKPFVSQGDVAAHFGYTQGWVSRIIRCDAFRERLAARKNELTDPLLVKEIEEKFKSLVDRSLEVLLEKLDMPNVGTDVALKAAELGAKALGMTDRHNGAVHNTTFVVAMPEKAITAQDWIKNHSPLPRPEVGGTPILDVTPE